jgi:hypothetical protein
MTPHRARVSLTTDEALHILYGDGTRDLSDEGFQAALIRLRNTSPDLERPVVRALKPVLEEYAFPRRKTAWQDTSRGLRARLFFLPENPHLERDTQDIRNVLGVAPGLFEVREGDALWTETATIVSDRAKVRRVAVANRLAKWVSLHRHFAAGHSIDRASYFSHVTEGGVAAAEQSARIDLSGDMLPAWLGGDPMRGAPYDNAVARLCDRHHLPMGHQITDAVGFYALSGDRVFVSNVNFVRALIALGSAASDKPHGTYDSFTISIGGVDEYVTQDDWNAMWKQWIWPQQLARFAQRGSRPHGRRGKEFERLQAAMPLYREMVLHGFRVDEALAVVERRRVKNRKWPDLSTARRAVEELDRLLVVT